MENIKRDFPKILVSWGLGSMLYIAAAILTIDVSGIPTCFFQSAIAFVFGGICVGLIYLIKIPMRFFNLDKYQKQKRILNFSLLTLGFLLLCFAQQLGITSLIYDSVTEEYFLGPNIFAVLAGFFMVIFSIINW